MGDILGNEMREALQRFAGCKHTTWKCEGCSCRADRGTIAGPERARINELEEEVESLHRIVDSISKDKGNDNARA